MQEKQVLVKNLNINYKVFGDGQPILLLHGWRSSSERWQNVGEVLSAKFRVVVPDLPGFGKSDEPKIAWSTDDYVDFLREFSEKIPELRDGFFLMGHSFGGMLSAKFSIKYAQKVGRLFLVSASCIRLKTPSKKAIYNVSRIFKIFYFFPYYEMFRKFIYKYVIRRSDYPYVSGIMKEIYLKVISDDLSYKLPFIKVPTIIIWGKNDDLTPIEHAEIIHDKIHNSKLVVIPDQKHNLHIAVPEMLAQKVIENT